MVAQLGLDPRQGAARSQPGPIQHAERRLDLTPSARVHAAAPHADHVHRASGGGHAVHHDERRHILDHLGIAADVGVGPDAGERLHAGEPSDGGAILDGDVPRQAGVVDDDHVVTDDAVVGDMATGHHEAVIAHARVQARAGRAMDGDILAYHRVVADPDAHRNTVPVLEVLRRAADDGAVPDPAAGADGDAPLEHDVGADLAALADSRVRSDDGVGRDADSRGQLGTRVDHSRRVDHGVLFLGLLRLVVVGADDVVGQVGVGRGVQHRRALPLEDDGVALLFAHLLDEAADVLEDLAQHGFFFFLQRALQVVHEPPGVAHLPLQELLLLASRVGGQKLPLLLQLVAYLFQLGPLGIHLLLHGRLFLLQLFPGRPPRRRARQDTLDVHEADTGAVRGLGRERRRSKPHPRHEPHHEQRHHQHEPYPPHRALPLFAHLMDLRSSAGLAGAILFRGEVSEGAVEAPADGDQHAPYAAHRALPLFAHLMDLRSSAGLAGAILFWGEVWEGAVEAPSDLECRPHREVEVPELLAPPPVQVHAVVHADRSKGRHPAKAYPAGVMQVGDVELLPGRNVRPPHVPHVDERRRPDAEEERDGVLDVSDQLDVAADPRPAGVLRRHLLRLEAPDGVGATEEEALEERDRLSAPAERVAGHEAHADHVVPPGRMEVRGRRHRPDPLLAEPDPGEVHPDRGTAPAGRLEGAVPGVPRDPKADEGREVGALLVDEVGAGGVGDVADPVLADPVEGVPARVVPDGIGEPDVAAEGVDGVIREDSPIVEQVEARRQRPVEQPGLREAHRAQLGVRAAAQPDEHLPAAAEEVSLGEVHRSEQAVLGAVTTADGEEARRLLGHVDVDDDLVLGGAGDGGGVDLLEIVQVRELLLGAGELLGREQIALGHGDLAAQDLLLAARITRDVDALDEHLGSLADLEGDVDLAVRQVLDDARVDVDGGPADGAVHVGDLLDALPQLGSGEHIVRLELDPPPDLLHGQHPGAGDIHAADPELRALDHDDPDGSTRLDPVDLDIG